MVKVIKRKTLMESNMLIKNLCSESVLVLLLVLSRYVRFLTAVIDIYSYFVPYDFILLLLKLSSFSHRFFLL